MGEHAEDTLLFLEEEAELRAQYYRGELSDEEAYELGIIDELGFEEF